MTKYVKLGPKAGGFSDPSTGFKILPKEIKKLGFKERNSGRIKIAVRGGHLVSCTEKEYETYKESLEEKVEPLEEKINILKDQLKDLEVENKALKKNGKEEEDNEPTLQESLDLMTNDALNTYYEKNFEVDKAQIKIFKKLNHDDKVAELLDLEKED